MRHKTPSLSLPTRQNRQTELHRGGGANSVNDLQTFPSAFHLVNRARTLLHTPDHLPGHPPTHPSHQPSRSPCKHSLSFVTIQLISSLSTFALTDRTTTPHLHVIHIGVCWNWNGRPVCHRRSDLSSPSRHASHQTLHSRSPTDKTQRDFRAQEIRARATEGHTERGACLRACFTELALRRLDRSGSRTSRRLRLTLKTLW